MFRRRRPLFSLSWIFLLVLNNPNHSSHAFLILDSKLRCRYLKLLPLYYVERAVGTGNGEEPPPTLLTSTTTATGRPRRLWKLQEEEEDLVEVEDSARTRRRTTQEVVEEQHPTRTRRKKSTDRKPKHYWCDPSNLRRELEAFWEDTCGIPLISSSSSLKNRRRLVIPNESLLRYYGRHDLRGAIASQGGRDLVVEKLGGGGGGITVIIMPGRWSEAVRQSPELRLLIQLDDTNNLSAERPPCISRFSCSSTSSTKTTINSNSSSSRSSRNRDENGDDLYHRRWLHQSTRRPKGYWTSRTMVLQELYMYVDDYRTQHHRPSIWMPRPSELTKHGRHDLRQALIRFFPTSSSSSDGKRSSFETTLGMVPYREWHYFEGQLELVSELVRYCDDYQGSDCSHFPCVSHMQSLPDYQRLHSLIQYHGGRKFLALRLGMTSTSSLSVGAAKKDSNNSRGNNMIGDMNWGKFDLEFALRLLTFVRNDQLRRNPPVKYPAIFIPTEKALLRGSGDGDAASSISKEEGAWLRDKIVEYGGYENVARRLGLAFLGPL